MVVICRSSTDRNDNGNGIVRHLCIEGLAQVDTSSTWDCEECMHAGHRHEWGSSMWRLRAYSQCLPRFDQVCNQGVTMVMNSTYGDELITFETSIHRDPWGPATLLARSGNVSRNDKIRVFSASTGSPLAESEIPDAAMEISAFRDNTLARWIL